MPYVGGPDRLHQMDVAEPHASLFVVQDWWSQALCAALPKEMFFKERERGKSTGYKEGKKVCAKCPVREECLEHALRVETAPGIGHFTNPGLFGGKTPEERRLMIRWLRKEQSADG